MADKEFKHTTSAEWEAFMAKSLALQMAEIWMNTRETNGEVAEVKRDLNESKRTAEKTAVALSDHLREQEMERAEVSAIKKWGYRGTVALVVLIAAFGGPPSVLHAIQLIEKWG